MSNLVITIGRQFGSGGRAIGKMVADKLGIKVYDKELIDIAAKESGIDHEILKSYDEKPTNSFLYSLSLGSFSYESSVSGIPNIPVVDKIFAVQSQIIRNLAEQESCVIIGRCADTILKNHDKLLTVFVHGDFDLRIKRVSEYEQCSHDKASELIRKADKKRANYYNYFSDNKWGVSTSYDLCINSRIGLELASEIIVDIAKNIR